MSHEPLAMSLQFEPVPYHQLIQLLEQAYPEEACGVLLGCLGEAALTGEMAQVPMGCGPERRVLQLWPAPNAWDAGVAAELRERMGDGAAELVGQPATPADELTLGREHRFWIDPQDLLAAQRYARDQGWQIVGIYHSHPDHPAVPSECDRRLAWQGYSYVIASVVQGQVRDVQSWRLNEAGSFEAEPLRLNP